MKLTKATIYRLTLGINCGCNVVQEFTDATYKTPVAESQFDVCVTHTPGQHSTGEAASIIRMMLTESLENEAQKLAEAPATFIRTSPESLNTPVVNLPPGIKIGNRRENPRVAPINMTRGRAAEVAGEMNMDLDEVEPDAESDSAAEVLDAAFEVLGEEEDRSKRG